MKPRLRVWIAGFAALVVAIIVAVVGIIAYSNGIAKRRAQEFCDLISIGSDIAAATYAANERKILWGESAAYTFYFSGFMFDKAVCEVSVDKEAKVISKKAEMEYD